MEARLENARRARGSARVVGPAEDRPKVSSLRTVPTGHRPDLKGRRSGAQDGHIYAGSQIRLDQPSARAQGQLIRLEVTETP